MATFTAIALDRLIDTGAPKTMAGVNNYYGSDPKLERRNSTPNSTLDKGISAPITRLEKAASVPSGKLEPRNGTSAMTVDHQHHWTQISPALYATPEPTPLPDSPSSFPPSPYIINHKRRGPRLVKSFSEDDVAIHNPTPDDKKLDENVKDAEKEVASATKDNSVLPEELLGFPEEDDGASSIQGPVWDRSLDDISGGELGVNELTNGVAAANSSLNSVAFSFHRDGDADDFFDPQESLSARSNAESENNAGIEHSLNAVTPMAEFYDAWEELSPEGGPQPPVSDIEAELHEIRLSLIMEIEKRKQAEEMLKNTRAQWQKIREELSLVGLTVPADLTVCKDEQLNDTVEGLSLQMELARFVSNSIGRGTAKAEVEMEMEVQMESRNFEIARLLDRLHYYEAVNREMSQRNQEAIETSRRLRQGRKRRQRWVWGSIATTVTLGAAALAWSYFPAGKGLHSTNPSRATEGGSESSP